MDLIRGNTPCSNLLNDLMLWQRKARLAGENDKAMRISKVFDRILIRKLFKTEIR